jgi:hypothetical protein
VLGKPSPEPSEHDDLYDIGRAIAAEGTDLITTKSSGANAIVADGYMHGGRRPRYLKRNEEYDPAWGVLIFTDDEMLARLDATRPGWRDRGWVIINGADGTAKAAAEARKDLSDGGTTDR